MSDARHYERLAVRPQDKSRYAFLLTCFALSDVEPKPSLWLGPAEITQDMAPKVKAFWVRWNPVLTDIDKSLREHAVNALRFAEVPEAKLSGQLSPGAEALVQALVSTYRRESLERDTIDILKRGAPIDDDGRFCRELSVRVITATDRALGSPGFAATAAYLNEGLPRRKGDMGLDRHHIRRAYAGLDKMLERLIRATWPSRLASPEMLAELMFADLERVRHLDTVYRHALARPAFKDLRGKELGWAIHDQIDINEALHRAERLDAGKAAGRAKPQFVIRVVSRNPAAQAMGSVLRGRT